MNKSLKIIILVIVVAGIAFMGIKAINNAKAKDVNMPQAKIYPIVVSEMSPKINDVTLTLPYLAEVSNDKDVKLSSNISARVINIKSSGLHVSKGEVIAQLDTTPIRSTLLSTQEQIKAARVSLQNMKATHQRTQQLLKVQGASIEESQNELTAIANNESQIAALKQKEIELQNNLSYVTIVSPVDGVIARTFSNNGAVTLPGKPLIDISAVNGFYLLIQVPSNLAIQSVLFQGKFYLATSLESSSNGLAEYKVYVEDHSLKSGERLQVDVVLFHDKGTLLPFDAILNRDGKDYVLVSEKNKAFPQEVHILKSGEQGVVIKESLKDKKIVVAKPDILLRLVSGYALQIKE